MVGTILCVSFCEVTSDTQNNPKAFKVKTFRIDQKPWKGKNKIDDSKIAKAIYDELGEYNMTITWNGKMFDLPFVNAVSVKAGKQPLAPQFNLDLMYYARGNSMKIGSSKMVNVAKYFNTSNQKSGVDWDTWQLAGTGDKKAMDAVVTHCEADVKVTGELYWRMLPMIRTLHR